MKGILLGILAAVSVLPGIAAADPVTQTVTNTACSGSTCTSTTYTFQWDSASQRWLLVSAQTVVVPWRTQTK